MPEGDDDLGMDFDELLDDRFVFGSVDEVTDQIIALAKPIGFNRFSAAFNGSACRMIRSPSSCISWPKRCCRRYGRGFSRLNGYDFAFETALRRLRMRPSSQIVDASL